MKYFSIYIPDSKTNPPRQPTPKQEQEMSAFVADAVKRGEFLSGGGFLSLATHGAIVRRSGDTSSVLDGPYVESKELVGGFAMLEYPTREAAIDGAKRFLAVVGDGECRTYQIMEGGGEGH